MWFINLSSVKDVTINKNNIHLAEFKTTSIEMLITLITTVTYLKDLISNLHKITHG